MALTSFGITWIGRLILLWSSFLVLMPSHCVESSQQNTSINQAKALAFTQEIHLTDKISESTSTKRKFAPGREIRGIDGSRKKGTYVKNAFVKHPVHSVYESIRKPVRGDNLNLKLGRKKVTSSGRPNSEIKIEMSHDKRLLNLNDREDRKSKLNGQRSLTKQIVLKIGEEETIDQNNTIGEYDEMDDDEFQHLISYKGEERMLSHGQCDTILCPPCQCRSCPPRMKYANCAHARLIKMPTMLPRDIWNLNMSSNYLKSFNLSRTHIYPNISTLDFSKNKIRTIIFLADHGFLKSLTTLNFNRNLIKYLDNVSFENMPNLRILTLSNNEITLLSSSMFKGCKKLQVLDLSRNKIIRIDAASFDPLGNLLTLVLSHNNNLGYNRAFFKKRLFSGLQKLRRLYIEGSSNGAERYPNAVLGSLTNLQELYIDGLMDGSELGPELKNLIHLKILSFSPGYSCSLKKLSSTFLQNVPYIKSLSFFSCNFKYIDPNAFLSVRRLETYIIRHPVMYNFSQAFRDLEGLQKTSLKSLTLSYFHNSRPPCQTLSSTEGHFLYNLALEELDLSSNYLVILGNDFLQTLPKTLKKLTLNDNKFTMTGYLWTRLTFLPNLSELDMRNQNMENYRNKQEEDEEEEYYYDRYRSHNIGQENARGNIDNTCLHKEIDTSPIPSYSQNIKHGYDHNDDGLNFTVNGKDKNRERRTFRKKSVSRTKLKLPHNLKIIKASRYIFFGDVLFTHKVLSKSLSHIYFSKSFLTDWGRGVMPESVVYADLGDNFCDIITPNFFPVNNSLEYLFLHKNYLGPVLSSDADGDIFASLGQLIYLNLDVNSIFHLPSKFFKGLKNLQSLALRENKIQILDIDFSFTPELRLIDLSKNSITWISRSTRQDLDIIASHHRLEIDLTDNPLPCTCEGIELLRWMLTTKAHMLNSQILKCSRNNRNEGRIGDIEKKIKELQRQCASVKYLIIVGAFVGALFFIIVGGILLYRNRWRLIYSRNTWLVSLFGFRPMGNTASGCNYDAYVVYCQEDRDFALVSLLEELEQKRGHKVCVEDRDFIPGTFNFNNITCAVQNSTVTLLILSSDFMKDKELEYAIQMALMEEYSSKTKRDILLLLVYKRLRDQEISKDLLLLMKKGRFLEFPSQEIDGQLVDVTESILKGFWDRLSGEIGHTDKLN